MPDNTEILSLPIIQPAQAQKHVTHNQALLKLDALVQLAVIDSALTNPPANPVNGNRYLLPAGSTSAWNGQDNNIAVYEGNTWAFYTPNSGWVAWIETTEEQLIYNGTFWIPLTDTITLQETDLLGIAMNADAFNRLAVKSPATLFTHAGAGHQLKLNKALTSDTASLVLQTDWEGHAEIGLNGNDDFSIKTSLDGTSWLVGLNINATNSRVSFPIGISGRLAQFDLGGSTFFGEGAGFSDDLSGNSNVFIGTDAGRGNINGASNTALGGAALFFNTTGSDNTAIGRDALRYTVSGGNNETNTNCSGLGHDCRVSGPNQVQLGNSATTTYAYGAIQNRSDRRDKADIQNTKLGLSFIQKLRPVDFRWDYRDNYFDKIETTDPETDQVTIELCNAKQDGSRKGKRFHHGFIAQEVKEVMDAIGVDFGGYQDHSINGGSDVLSIGYEQFIAPMVAALQEMSKRIQSLEAQNKA